LGNTPINERPPKIAELYKNNFSDFKSKFDKNKQEYLADAKSLIQQIKVPILFVFVAKHGLDDVDEVKISNEQPMELLWNFPQFVTKQMVEEMTNGFKLGCFTQVQTKRLPKPIIDNESPQRNKMFATDAYYPDQETHFNIAEWLIPKIKEIL
jgi:hypothetical protein